MRRVLTIFMFFSLFFVAFSEEIPSLIVEFPKNLGTKESDDDIKLQCTSWRFGVESNNMGPWESIPSKCGDYVKEYMLGKGYGMDIERVSDEAVVFAKSVPLKDDGKNAWVFDVDETLLSNLPYYNDHGYGLEIFDRNEFAKWVEKGMAPPLIPSLKLYEEVMKLGFKVFLLTGRSEDHKDITVENLINAGFKDWDKLILRASEDHGKSATLFKSEKRTEMVIDGYRILGNSGDQWSDLLGYSMSVRSFKLPNPMYYIP